MTRSFRFAAWIFLGTLLVQSAWILTLPPFRGIDEFDHVYRAASVADGHWLPSGELPADGRGELVYVPPGIVTDAEPICSALPYTGPANCTAVDTVAPGVVSVASGAARYNPAFYFVVGSAAQQFDGAPAMYVMRWVNALLCSALLAAAAWVTARWARTRWPSAALVVTLTPVAVYSTAVPGPNGLEMCAAAGLWSCLIALGRGDAEKARTLLVLATAFAVPVLLVRGLGPLWFLAVCLVGLVHVGPRTTWARLRAMPRTAALCGLAIAAVGAAAAAWTLGVDSMASEEGTTTFPDPVASTARSVPLWFFQSIAAFPVRNEPAPTVVYAAAGIVMAGLIGWAFARADRRQRTTLATAFALALLLPFLLSVATHETHGQIWQGRYGWPVSLGVLLLAGAVLDAKPPQHRLVGPAWATAALLWVVAHAVSTVDVVQAEQRTGVLAGDSRWWTVDPWLIGVVAAAGVACWCVGVVVAAAQRDESQRSAHNGQTLALVSNRGL